MLCREFVAIHCPWHILLDNIIIVVGFYEDSFSGSELTYFHFVRVGYQKGAELAEQDLFFYIVDIPGTASECYYIIIYSRLPLPVIYQNNFRSRLLRLYSTKCDSRSFH